MIYKILDVFVLNVAGLLFVQQTCKEASDKKVLLPNS